MGLPEQLKAWRESRQAAEKAALMDKVDKLYRGAFEVFQPTPEVQFGIDLAKKVKQQINAAFEERFINVFAASPVGIVSQDAQYQVDTIAEKEIKIHFEEAWENGHNYGYVTEDQGLVLPPAGKAEIIYLIDLDGSRMIQKDAENGTVTMVGVPGDIPNPTFSDIQFAITAPIHDRYGLTFHTKQMNGSQEVIMLWGDNENFPLPKKARDRDVESSSFVWESYSANPEVSGVILRNLLDDNNFNVTFPSGSFGLLQVVMEQHNLYVDIRKRLFDEFPHLPIKIGEHAKAAMPLDIAAGWFMLRALGGKVTDAYGHDLDNLPLWSLNDANQWTDESQISVVAAITPQLHAEAMGKIAGGFANLARRRFLVT